MGASTVTKSVDQVWKTIQEAKKDLMETPSLDSIKEWDGKIREVCPKPSDLEGEDWDDISDMLFEWTAFSIGVRRRIFEAEERRVG